MQLRRDAPWISAATVVVIITVAWFARPKDRFEDSAQRTAFALEKQDWGSVYDLASPVEREQIGLNRKQFVEVANSLAKQADVTGPVRYAPIPTRLTARREYIFTFLNEDPTVYGPHALVIAFGNGQERSHPAAFQLLMGLNHVGRDRSRVGSLNRLHNALKSAGAPMLVDFVAKVGLRTDRLAMAARGEIETDDAWVRLSDL